MSVAISLGAPNRQYLSIEVELSNSRVALINDVDGPVGANRDPALAIGVGLLPRQ